MQLYHARIQEFLSGGGGGGSRPDGQKTAWTTFLFFSPQLITEGSNGLLQRKLYFPKHPEGGPTFSRGGGVQLFPGGGGPNANFYKTHITCDFSGEGPKLLIPPWTRTCIF